MGQMEAQILSLQRQVRSMGVSAGVSRSNPVVQAVRQYLDPRGAVKASVHGLDDAKPSQKYTLFARSSVQVPNGSTIIGTFAPTAFSNALRPDLFLRVIGNGNIDTLITTDPGTNGTKTSHYSIDNPGGSGLDGWDFRIPSASLKITYDGAELYRGGTLHMYHQDSAEIYANKMTNLGAEAFASTNAKWSDIVSLCASYSQSRALSLSEHPTIEVTAHPSTQAWFSSETCSGSCFPERQQGSDTDLANGVQTLPFGTTTDADLGRPCVCFTYVNTTGSTVSFLFETVIHVERYSISSIALNTPSVNPGAEVSSLVTAFKKHIAANHHSVPPKVSGVKVIKHMWPVFKKYAPPGIATTVVDAAIGLL